jgi:hypothetical protein
VATCEYSSHSFSTLSIGTCARVHHSPSAAACRVSAAVGHARSSMHARAPSAAAPPSLAGLHRPKTARLAHPGTRGQGMRLPRAVLLLVCGCRALHHCPVRQTGTRTRRRGGTRHRGTAPGSPPMPSAFRSPMPSAFRSPMPSAFRSPSVAHGTGVRRGPASAGSGRPVHGHVTRRAGLSPGPRHVTGAGAAPSRVERTLTERRGRKCVRTCVH